MFKIQGADPAKKRRSKKNNRTGFRRFLVLGLTGFKVSEASVSGVWRLRVLGSVDLGVREGTKGLWKLGDWGEG